MSSLCATGIFYVVCEHIKFAGIPGDSTASELDQVKFIALPHITNIVRHRNEVFRLRDLFVHVVILAFRIDWATGLRISEILALRWSDIDVANSCIRVTRAYVYGKFGPPKSKASKKPVPLHPLLAEWLATWRKETTYPANDDLVFPSVRLKGQKPPRANMLVADHLQPAARKAGITEPVGFHTLRRTLASALMANGSDVRLVQELLRHSNPIITLDAYTRSTTPAKMKAQEWVMQQLLPEDAKAMLANTKPGSSRAM